MSTTIKDIITESIQIKIEAADALPVYIERAGAILVRCLIDGGKIISCGDGESAIIAQHFASVFLHQLGRERPSLPALSLSSEVSTITSIAGNDGYKDIYAKQLRALGETNDVLIVFSATGQAKNITKAIEAALNKDMFIIAVTGSDGGNVAGLVSANDVEIRIPANSLPRILESQLMVTHVLCDYVDQQLFGNG